MRLNEGEWLKKLEGIHNSAKQECNKLYNTLSKIINDFDKVEIMAHASLLTQFQPFDEPELNSELRDIPILNYIIGLCLKSENTTNIIPNPKTNSEIIHLAKEYLLNFTRKLSSQVSISDRTLEEEQLILSARLINLINQVTPSKYEFQGEEMFLGIFNQLDDYFDEKYGFKAVDAWNFDKKIIKHYERKLAERIEKVKRAKIRYIDSLKEPEISILTKELLKEKKLSEDHYIDNYLTFNLFTLVKDLFIFDNENICAELYIENSESFKNYLNLVSCEFGESNNKYETPIDENIISIKPYVKINETLYFCPIPKHIIQNLPAIFENLLDDEKKHQTKVWEKYAKAKSKYLEDKTIECLERIFPKKDIYRNLKYEVNGKINEVDAIVKYDTKVLIFESKSGQFTKAAKRGAQLTLKSNLKSLIYESFSQGKKVISYLKNTKEAIFKDSNRNQINLDICPTKSDFYVISVLLDDLMIFASNPKKIQQLDLFHENEFPWVIDIFTLDIITRHISIPSLFIHYIKQRLMAINEDIFNSFGELEFLSYYLEFGNFYVIKGEEGKLADYILLKIGRASCRERV